MDLQKIKRYTWYILYAGAAAFLAYYLHLYTKTFISLFSPTRLPLLFGAFALNAAAFFVMALNWAYMVRRKANISVFECVKGFYVSQVTRYIPGNVWSFIARFKVGGDKGLSKGTVAYLLVIENVNLIVVSFVVALFALPILHISLSLTIVVIITILLIFCCILFIRPDILTFLIAKALAKFTSDIPSDHLSRKELCIVTVFFVMYWLLFGLSFVCILALLAPSILPWWVIIGLNAVAWLIGYLTFLTPSGIGIREGVITLALKPFIGATSAFNISIISRFIFIISEVSVLGVLLSVGIFKRKDRVV